MKKSLLFSLLSSLMLSGLFVQSANANVIITGTRVIYPSNAKSITVKLTNSGDSPELVQSTIEEGELGKDSNKKNVPFLLTPPIARIEPNSSQDIRIIFTGEQTLSNEVEHLYWLNVLDIPSRVESTTGSQLSFAINNRLKLFYRPSHLKQPTEHDFEKLKFSIKENKLMMENTTPYYIALVDVNIDYCNTEFKPITAKPLSTYTVCNTHKKKLENSFIYTVIGDYGSARKIHITNKD